VTVLIRSPGHTLFDVVQQTLRHQRILVQIHQVRSLKHIHTHLNISALCIYVVYVYVCVCVCVSVCASESD